MKKLILFAAALATTLAIPALAADSDTWELDQNHSAAHFTVRHMGISNVQGSFAKMSGTVKFDDKDVAKSSVNITIDVSSVDTGVEARDKDLRSDHFFDVAKYPTMTFQSTKISKGGSSLKMTGNLTIHGITKEVTFDVDGPSAPLKEKDETHRGAAATAKIMRDDFGISSGMGSIGNPITLSIDIDMMQK